MHSNPAYRHDRGQRQYDDYKPQRIHSPNPFPDRQANATATHNVRLGRIKIPFGSLLTIPLPMADKGAAGSSTQYPAAPSKCFVETGWADLRPA
jgi:hypothetical protein